MKIFVKIFTTFQQWSNTERTILKKEKDGEKLIMDVEYGATVNELFHIIGIPDEIERSFFVNGRHAELSTQLTEGDTLLVLPVFCGG